MGNQISPGKLLEELASLESLRVPNVAQRQRAYKRFVTRGDAELFEMEKRGVDSRPLPVLLRDIGRGGIGFICERELPQLSMWRVQFLQHNYAVGEQAIVIKHCREVRRGVHLVGGQVIMPSGLLVQLGVDHAAIHGGMDISGTESDDGSFVAPEEMK
jgi:hypothetical protein